MKNLNRLTWAAICCCILLCTSCSAVNNIFGPKYGCPSNGKNIGAERLMGGGKLPKANKFRA